MECLTSKYAAMKLLSFYIEQTDRKRQGKKINQIVTNVLAHISENQLIRVHSVHLPRRKLLPEFL